MSLPGGVTARSVAVADVVTARTEIAAKDELIGDLRRELDERRRSWWCQLIG